MKQFTKFIKISTITLVAIFLISPAQAATVLKFAGHYPEAHPSTKLLRKAAAEVETQTEGRVKLKIFPADQLGDYTLLFQDIMRGSVDMGQVNLPSEYDIRLEAFSIPYIVKDYNDIAKVFSYDSNFSQMMKTILQEKNIHFFGFNVIGLIGLGSKKEPNEPFNPEVNKGILIRVPPLKVYQLTAQALKYRTTTINWSDVFSAMQTGVVDGWIGGTPDVNYLTFKDVEDYYVLYNNFVECNAFIMSQKAHQELGADAETVGNIFKDVAAASFAMAQKYDTEYIDKMQKAGIKIIRPTPEEAQNLSRYIHKNIWPKLHKLYGKEIFDAIKKDLGE